VRLSEHPFLALLLLHLLLLLQRLLPYQLAVELLERASLVVEPWATLRVL